MNNVYTARRAMRVVLPLVSLSAVFSLAARADDPPASGWSGKGEAGFALASGNSGGQSENANAKVDIAYDSPLWKHALGASGVYASAKNVGEADKTTTANRWDAYEQSNYKFSDKSFWFGGVRHEDDRIGSFEYQSSVTTGLGHQFYNSDRTKLSLQLGVGYKLFRQRVVPPEISRRDHDIIGTGLLDYQHAITDTTSVMEKMSVESGSSNTLVQNDIGLQVKMSTLLAIALAYGVRYNSEPGDGFSHYDRLTTINLVYKFKQTPSGVQ